MIVKLTFADDTFTEFESDIEVRDGMKIRVPGKDKPTERTRTEFVLRDGKLAQDAAESMSYNIKAFV